MPSDLFTSKEAAEYIGVSRSQLTDAARNGRIESQIGSSTHGKSGHLFTQEAVDEYKRNLPTPIKPGDLTMEGIREVAGVGQNTTHDALMSGELPSRIALNEKGYRIRVAREEDVVKWGKKKKEEIKQAQKDRAEAMRAVRAGKVTTPSELKVELVDAEPGHVHHWVCEPPNGAKTWGVCKCGSRREFYNGLPGKDYVDKYTWNQMSANSKVNVKW